MIRQWTSSGFAKKNPKMPQRMMLPRVPPTEPSMVFFGLIFGPVLENIVYFYARSQGDSVSIGKIGNLECDFMIRNAAMDYSYVQVAYTIALSKDTEDREYRPLEKIADNYPKYVMTTDYLLQQRNGIKHVNLMDFMRDEREF